MNDIYIIFKKQKKNYGNKKCLNNDGSNIIYGTTSNFSSWKNNNKEKENSTSM